MVREKRVVAQLFALIDGGRLPPDAFTQAVLERILFIDPECERARMLLDTIDGSPPPPDRVLSAIEEAEELAAQGVWYGARAVADEVRRHFAGHPVAQAWLSGAHLLWEA